VRDGAGNPPHDGHDGHGTHGAAAGHDLLKTAADPFGRKVLGTINNCAAGVTHPGSLSYTHAGPDRTLLFSDVERTQKYHPPELPIKMHGEATMQVSDR
jgi:hypothetical protein